MANKNYEQRFDSRHFKLAMEVMQQLHNMSPFLTGNMRNSIKIAHIYPSRTIIEISPMPYSKVKTGNKTKFSDKSYAKFVNDSKKHYHWVQKTLELACNTYGSQIGAQVKKESL